MGAGKGPYVLENTPFQFLTRSNLAEWFQPIDPSAALR
jgi:hypothetical protein